MQKLLEADILDILPTENGFIYAARETLPDESVVGTFHCYNRAENTLDASTVVTYIREKFGENGIDVARAVGDFITCGVEQLSNGTFVASYPDGSLKVVGIGGEIITEAQVFYQDAAGCSPVSNGNDLWFAVPDGNAIINYSIKHNRIEFRIGGPKSKSFCHPVSLVKYDNTLYICNAYSYKIRAVNLETYNVSDYKNFNEPVLKYFRSADTEYVMMQSGVYAIVDRPAQEEE